LATALNEIAVANPARAGALRQWLADIAQSEGLLERLPTRPRALAPGAPWHLLRLIGSGGMGEVWLGERSDGAFQRQVAVKFLRADRATLGDRLARERELLARLHHPGIAMLLDGGVSAQGEPYLVTEWIDGRRLDHWVREARPELRTRVDVLRRIAQAVGYAHTNLIVHRDLKPANVMIDRDGIPHLLDFGIARLLDDPQAGTLTDDRALTPAFAAPEQLMGHSISTRCDIYALGALLYWLLTEQTPHDSEGLALAELVKRVCVDPIRPPSARRSRDSFSIDVDLDAIVLTALARAPERRYASAEFFALDLQRWLDGQSVSARLPTRFERMRRILTRHPLESALMVALAVSLVSGVAATLWQARSAELAAARAEQERDSALSEVDRSEQLIDTFARLFREAEGEEKLDASAWLDRAAKMFDQPGVTDATTITRFRYKLAAIENDRGQHKRAAILLEQVLAAPIAQLSAAERTDALCRLGSVLNMLGRKEQALGLFAQGTTLGKSLRGSQRLALVDCLASRASIALVNGKADTLAQEAARAALRELDAVSTNADLRFRRAGVLYTQAALFDMSGRNTEAAAVYAKVMRLDEELGNTESGDHAALLTALAGSLDRAGNPRAADARYAEGIAIYERTFGLHTNLGADLANQANIKLQLEEPQAAMQLARRAIEVLHKLGNVNQVALANAHLAEGKALGRIGEFAASDAALATSAKLFAASGIDAIRVHRVAIAKAELKLAQNDPDAARNELEPALLWLRAQQRHGTIIEALAVMVQLELVSGRLAQAETAAREALVLVQSRAHHSALDIARAELDLAEALSALKQTQSANALIDQATPVLENALGVQHPRVIKAKSLRVEIH
jgi:eukaryotic-like serine/threonine-protein kinase